MCERGREIEQEKRVIVENPREKADGERERERVIAERTDREKEYEKGGITFHRHLRGRDGLPILHFVLLLMFRSVRYSQEGRLTHISQTNGTTIARYLLKSLSSAGERAKDENVAHIKRGRRVERSARGAQTTPGRSRGRRLIYAVTVTRPSSCGVRGINTALAMASVLTARRVHKPRL